MSAWISSRVGEAISMEAKISSEFLHDDALDLEEMVFVRRAEFFGARDVDEMVELFPAFDVGLDLGDELVEFFGGHRRFRLALARARFAGKGK